MSHPGQIAAEKCPHCGAVLKFNRVGIRLTPIKARLFDLIKASGDIGTSLTELASTVYPQASSPSRYVDSVKSHINQMNDILVETEYRIVADRERAAGMQRQRLYRLTRESCAPTRA